ncbi:MAG: DUF2095 domain-containing protein [Candidatus Thorarchaeota archaeon]|nr:MAG: DUF2095 domain-containing protein [Candidatus Thorarchaeota archaeon]
MSEDGEFRKEFPTLNRELKENTTKTYRIDGVRTMSEESESTKSEKSAFEPDVVDYIRRCDTMSQAMEIVEFLLKQNEITSPQAKEIKSQLNTEGLRSFGAKKEKDHYLHHGVGEE